MRNDRFYSYLGAAILSALSAMVGNFVDGIIVSHLISSDGLSAINLCKPIAQFYYTYHQLFGLGGAMLIAVAIGAKNAQRVSDLLRATIGLAGIFTIAITLVGIFCPGVVVNWLCNNPELTDNTLAYARPLLIGSGAYMGVLLLSVLTAIDGAPKLVSWAMVVDNVVNLCLDLLFMGVFDWGIAGSSSATIIGHLVGITILATHYLKGNSKLQIIKGAQKAENGWSLSGQAAKTGAPFAIASICLTLYMLFANRMILSMNNGSDSIYIFSVMTNLLVIYNFFIAGSCQTLQQLGSLQVGEQDWDGLRYTTKRCFRFMMGCQALICIYLLIDAQSFCRLFDCPDELLSECCFAARIYAFAFFAFSVNYLMMVYLKLTKHGGIANFISITLSPIVLPFIWFSTHYAQNMLWWSNLLGYSLVLIIIMAWMILNKKKSITPTT